MLLRSLIVKEKLISQLIQRSLNLKQEYQSKSQDILFGNQIIRNWEQISRINGKIEFIISQLEKELSNYQSEWLCGSNYSLADIAWSTVLN